MLVFSRKEGEQIQIGDDITITVARVSASAVRLGIAAPPGVTIAREELLRRLAHAVQAVASDETTARPG